MDASGMLPGHIACFLFPCESPAFYPSIQKCRELRLERRAASDACLVPDRPGVTPCAWHSLLRSFYEAGLVLNHFLEASDLWLLHHHTSLLADTAACPRAPLFFVGLHHGSRYLGLPLRLRITYLSLVQVPVALPILGFFVPLLRCFIRTFCPVSPGDHFRTCGIIHNPRRL